MERKLVVMVALLGMCLLAPTALAGSGDNFDSYAADAVIPAGNDWVGWGGQEYANCIVKAGPAYSGENSLEALGGRTPDTDQVYVFGTDPKTGSWDFSVMTYVPSEGKGGQQYFNLMNNFPQESGAGANEWSFVQVYWDMNSTSANVDKFYQQGNAATGVPIQYDTWVEVSVDIDLTANTCEIFYDGVSVAAGTWSGGAVPNIQVMDIYPIPGAEIASAIYYDDLSLTPEPATMALLGMGGLMMLRRRRRKA